MAQHSTDTAVAGSQDSTSDAAASIRESLSALVDNEASEHEVHRLLKLSESDPDIQARWKRYHLARAIMHREPISPEVDLSERIGAAIAREDAHSTPHASKQWRNGLGKFAIAACATFAFVLGIQQFSGQGQPVPTEVVNSSETPVNQLNNVGGAPSGFELPPFAARTVSAGGNASSAPSAFPYRQPDTDAGYSNQALQDHFNQILLKHAERSATSGTMGLLPFARASKADAEPKE